MRTSGIQSAKKSQTLLNFRYIYRVYIRTMQVNRIIIIIFFIRELNVGTTTAIIFTKINDWSEIT